MTFFAIPVPLCDAGLFSTIPGSAFFNAGDIPKKDLKLSNGVCHMAAFFIAGAKFPALVRHQFMIPSTSGVRSGGAIGAAAAVVDAPPADVGRVDCFLRAMRVN